MLSSCVGPNQNVGQVRQRCSLDPEPAVGSRQSRDRLLIESGIETQARNADDALPVERIEQFQSAKPLLPTSRKLRSGNGRRICSTNCGAQSVGLLRRQLC